MTPANNGNYQGTINLKYNDNTTSTVFARDKDLVRDKTYHVTFYPPLVNKQPFQVNTVIGGEENNSYTISVTACE
jgi:hypothetical protein